MTPFAELAAKTNYSFLEGASFPEEMVRKAHELGYEAIAITDRHGVYGAPRAHVLAKQLGVHLIVGAEIPWPESSEDDARSALLLAKTREGYGNLCEILTEVHKDHETKTLSWRKVFEKSQDLFFVLPVDSPRDDFFPEIREAFGNRFYLLASHHKDAQYSFGFECAKRLSEKHDLRCLASNQPLFHEKARKPLHDVLRCIQHRTTLKKAGYKLLGNAERYLKSKSQIQKLFARHPEWLENTQALASQCTFSLDEIRYHYPTEWLPAGETASSYLRKLVFEGMHRRYSGDPPLAVRQQIEAELGLIAELSYEDYFLTTWDIVCFARSQKILCQGRGSAANSLVCFVLGITSIDPIRMNLLFERFISRERMEPPDIDIDFEHERREEVIQYIYQRYGRHRAAITAAVHCYRRRSSIREVAKVFEIPEPTVKTFIALTHKRKLSEVDFEAFHETAPDIPIATLKHYYRMVHAIKGYPRHLGTHVGGFVLCQEALTRNVPVEAAAMEDRTIVQWDKNDLDALGFVRVDVLGLGILTAIRKSFDYLKETYGKSLSLSTVPPEDPKIYEAVCQADTIGVFQIESRAQMNMLPRLRPRNFFDLVVEISIVRPGPIQGEMVHPYLRRRSGKEQVTYAHPDLEPILKKTFGVPLFQEQILKMAMSVAGFTGGEADALRRAMGSWRRDGPNRLSSMGERFRQGLMKKGITPEFAERIFSQIEGFAEYGFPESHAASFAILAYASAYLKVYYPDAFLTGLLNAQPMGFYSAHTLIHDAQRHGVQVLDVDVQRSHWDNHLEKPGHMRLGFREIKRLREDTAQALEKTRSEKPFESFFDFITRMKAALDRPLTKRELFYLAGANAFISLGIDRRQAFWEIQAMPIADTYIMPHAEEPTLLPKETAWEKINLDYEALGLSLFSHPIAYFRKSLLQRGFIDSLVLRKKKPLRKKIRVAGLVIARQMPPSASGVLFITLEDELGFMNLVIWKKVYEKYRDILISQSFLECEGKLEKAEDGNVLHVIVDKAAAMAAPGEIPKTTSYDFH